MTPPGTPLRNFRCADEVWQAAKLRAAADGTDLTKVLVAYLKRYGKAYVPSKESSP